MTKFSEDQEQALETMENFIKSKESVLTLRGYAGTGKSFIMKEFVQYLDAKDIPFVLCAPTHKAKLVLEEATGYDTITVHKLLSMSPNVEIFELDYRELEFASKGVTAIPVKGIVVVDEASMINSALYKLLVDKCSMFGSKILFVGDDKQLQPVKEGAVSPVFSCNNMITLTKIHRQGQDNGLLELLKSLRTSPKRAFSEIVSPTGSLSVYTDTKQFMVDSIPFFKKALETQDVNHVKLIAYTNRRVKALNKCVRKLVFGDKCTNMFNNNEILTGYDNLEFNGRQIYNSLDYIVISDPIRVERRIPYFMKLPGYELQIYDSIYKQVITVFVLDENIDKKCLDSLAQHIETTRMDAISAKVAGNKTLARVLWSKYYQTVGSFTTMHPLFWDNRVIKKKTFDYGYASTTHKVQGCSINTIFVDMKDILTCRSMDELRQLQYVSLSRTRNNAYILQ